MTRQDIFNRIYDFPILEKNDFEYLFDWQLYELNKLITIYQHAFNWKGKIITYFRDNKDVYLFEPFFKLTKDESILINERIINELDELMEELRKEIENFKIGENL